jgi:transcription elongation GreA/GreB family factor
MMSPTAVSQYLTDESLSFDLGILDEASQMPPENAIPSLARCRQVIVVGDSNQLPPTTFFQKNVTGEFALDEDEGGESETIDESILDMAKSVYVPRSLLWHYRSRHSGLINFCNRVIYDDKLIVYPSPTEKRPDMGVSLKKVEGIYQKSINPKEVSAIVKAALDHMKDDPERSLGLVTFNERQRNVIIDQMERAIEANGYAMSYVESWKTKNDGLESFFVKNLENVQGDERDVIFISTVYGPDKADGKVAQRFGPVTGAAGRRRLNVLFSRAKQKIVTFTSMSPADIAAKDGDLTGTAMLKDWLGYCERGGSGQGLKPERPGADRALSLESFVQEKVQAMGYQVDSLVGTEGYKLDLAVKSDLCPLGYLMGLEGDGKSYSQSASTRDRDRSRPEVLTGLGWKLNRIWSSAWYANPGAELAALKQGMETRLAKAQEELAKLPRGPEPGSEPATLSDRQEGDATFPKRQMAGSPQPPDYLAFSNPNTEMAKVATEEKAELAAVGDLVKIRYLDSPDKTMDIRLTQSRNDPQQGLVSKDSPLGSAILDQEVEDEVQFLANNEVKTVLIVSIDKAHPKVPLAPILMGGKPNGDGANTPEPQQPGQGMDSDNQPSDGENGPPGDLLGLISVKPGEESLLLDQDYQDTLAEMAITLIDTVGPIKLETLSQAISWSHGFSRRGTAIDNAIKKAIGKKREKTTAPDKEIVYWPPNIAPGKATPFRGMRVSNISREFNHVPYPELLGLAKEIVATTADSAQVQAMAARLEIKRLTKGLRDRLGEALKAAQKT